MGLLSEVLVTKSAICLLKITDSKGTWEQPEREQTTFFVLFPHENERSKLELWLVSVGVFINRAHTKIEITNTTSVESFFCPHAVFVMLMFVSESVWAEELQAFLLLVISLKVSTR